VLILQTIVMTVIFEGVTILSRLNFGSALHFTSAAGLPHIHHSLWGLIIVLVALESRAKPIWLILGFALILSDFVHHFFVLPYLVGRTEFP